MFLFIVHRKEIKSEIFSSKRYVIQILVSNRISQNINNVEVTFLYNDLRGKSLPLHV